MTLSIVVAYFSPKGRENNTIKCGHKCKKVLSDISFVSLCLCIVTIIQDVMCLLRIPCLFLGSSSSSRHRRERGKGKRKGGAVEGGTKGPLWL